MRNVESYEHLKALPQWVVIRTSNGVVREREHNGCWSQIGTSADVVWDGTDFPAKVLWSYAEEIAPDPLPPLPLSLISGIQTGVTVR